MDTVLICDDERDVTIIVAELLSREGIEALTCTDGREALRVLDERAIDLVVLDIMMPGMDGFEVCRRIRATSSVPVLFLTAKDTDVSQVAGFAVGADDYVTKPFLPRGLVARIKTHLQRSKRASTKDAPAAANATVIRCGAVTCDMLKRSAEFYDTPLTLTPTEFDLLCALAQAGGSAVPTGDLYRSAWHEEPLPQSRNSVMVYIRRLRRKLAAIDPAGEHIGTVWGVGYRLEASASAAAQTRRTVETKKEKEGTTC